MLQHPWGQADHVFDDDYEPWRSESRDEWRNELRNEWRNEWRNDSHSASADDSSLDSRSALHSEPCRETRSEPPRALFIEEDSYHQWQQARFQAFSDELSRDRASTLAVSSAPASSRD